MSQNIAIVIFAIIRLIVSGEPFTSCMNVIISAQNISRSCVLNMQDKFFSAAAEPKAGHEFGDLPEWDLTDLYPAKDSAEVKADFEFCEKESQKFADDYKGKLEELAKNGGLLETITRYEELSDKMGRLGSYAYLQYAQNTTDPDRSKFMGDTNEKLTSFSTPLLFFTLEMNRIDDAVLQAAV